MSEYNWSDELETDETSEGGANNGQPAGIESLPKHLRQLIAAAKRDEKAAITRANEAENKLRKNTIESVLSSKGVPAKVAGLIPDGVDSTPEGLSAWLAEYGDVFGTNAPNDTAQSASEGATGATPANADNDALARMQMTASTGSAPRGSQADMQAKINDPNLTLDQLKALIRGEAA